MRRAIRFPNFRHELRQSAWLAGFIDGEGSLQIARAPKGNCWPTLQIVQRDDDGVLLLAIADALGGAVKVQRARRMAEGYDANPYGQLHVSSKASLLGAIAYLDTYQLRTKKAREYVVWRGAVMAYVNEGGWSPVLPEAKALIESLRIYQGPNVPDYPELVSQL